MTNNTWEILHAHSTPVNRDTANALIGGLNYNPSAKDHIDFDLPPSIKSEKNLNEKQKQLIGLKFFRLTVIGVAAEQQKFKAYGTRYVCKCECGSYTYRYRRPLLKSKYQACGECLSKRDRLIQEHYRKTGRYLEDHLVWEKMGSTVEVTP